MSHQLSTRLTISLQLRLFPLLLGLCSLLPARGEYYWQNFAGLPGGRGNADGTGGAGRFYAPTGIARDGIGNLYVADTENHTIRKVTSTGVVTTWLNRGSNFGFADGTGSAAQFYKPRGIAVSVNGTVYVADTLNHTIRKATSDGVVTTLAGSPQLPGGADGIGSEARFNRPSGVAVDLSGNLYVADTENHAIRKVTEAGEVTTLAGLAGTNGSTDGAGDAARFFRPNGVAVDEDGNLYVTDTGNDTLRKVTRAGLVTTLAGIPGNTGSDDGAGTVARFYGPTGLARDESGNLVVTDSGNYTIRKMTRDGMVTTIAGSPGREGTTDATGPAARFYLPSGVAADASGNVWVADSGNHTIRQVSSTGLVTTAAGSVENAGSVDGTGSMARFSEPAHMAVDGNGNLYVAGSGENTIRKVTSDGVVTTLAGSGTESAGSTDGPAATARFYSPSGLAVDNNGNVFIADSLNHTIRKLTTAGFVTTLAGSVGNRGIANGTGSAARFDRPAGLAVDSAGNVYVADHANHTIRKVTAAGVVTTFAGSAGEYGSANGTGSAARFEFPSDVAIDRNGNLYVTDTNNFTIRKITSARVVTTLAGSPRLHGSADGTGSAARFYYPSGLAVDGSGNVFVADGTNNLIRKVTNSGVVTTIGGALYVFGGADGLGLAANFYSPGGIAVGPQGQVYVADGRNHRIVRGTPAGAPSVQVFPADGLGGSTASLHGTVNPNGLATTARFEYGLTASYGSSADMILSPDDDSTLHPVSVALTGLAAGTLHHFRLSATNAAGVTHTVDETFTTATPHQAWRQHHFGSPSDAGEAADSFDSDHDGLVNLIEYAFGLHPKDGSSAQLPSGQTVGGHFVLSFSQPAGVAGITYGAEWSPSLAGSSWTTVPDTGSGGSHTFSVAAEGNSTIFMRYRITVP